MNLEKNGTTKIFAKIQKINSKLTRTWALKSPDCANDFEHVSHLYGFSPV